MAKPKPLKRNDWERYLAGLRVVKKPPNEAFVITQKYAELAHCQPAVVLRYVMLGRINSRHCVAVLNNDGVKRRLLINWNATGYSFIKNRGPKNYPADFEVNDARIYKPIPVTRSPELSAPPPPVVKGGTDWIDRITDIGDVKLEIDKAKLRQLEAAQRIGDNKVLETDAVVDIVTRIAFTVRAQLRRFITLSAPEVMGCSDVRAVKEKLENNMRDVLSELEPMVLAETYYEEKE